MKKIVIVGTRQCPFENKMFTDVAYRNNLLLDFTDLNLKKEIKRNNIQREKDTRNGFWRY